MYQFERGEHVICKRNFRVDKVYTDPNGDFLVEISLSETGDVVQESDDMISTGVTGKFWYAFLIPDDAALGIYDVLYTVTHNDLITKKRSQLEVVE